jgi:hypothetical protein
MRSATLHGIRSLQTGKARRLLIGDHGVVSETGVVEDVVGVELVDEQLVFSW